MARTSRTFYERHAKEEKIVDQDYKIDTKIAPSVSKPTAIRYHGVRMVKGHVASIQALGDYTQVIQGISNEIISNLIAKEPLLLAQVLSTRYLVRGLPPSDYIFALAQSQAHNDNGLRKRTRDELNTTYYSTESNHVGVLSASSHLQSNIDSLLIHESDIPFLRQILEEDVALREKRQFPSFVPQTHTIDETDDDLCWLTQEMQKDWSSFLRKVGFSRNDNRNASSTTIRGSHPFKAYLTLGKRMQCDLGHFICADDAALVYDKYAVSRRTIGIKLSMFLFLFKRVKALKATYEESLRLSVINMGNMSAQEVASKCQDMAAKAVDHMAKANDTYFYSDKVLYPLLNSFANTSWRLIQPFPFRWESVDTLDIHKVVQKENDLVKELQDFVTLILTGEPPIRSIVSSLQEISYNEDKCCDDEQHESEIDCMVAQMETELGELMNGLNCKVLSFDRLFKLECQIDPLIKAGLVIRAGIINEYGCTLRKGLKIIKGLHA